VVKSLEFGFDVVIKEKHYQVESDT